MKQHESEYSDEGDSADDCSEDDLDNRYKVKCLANNKSDIYQPRCCEIGMIPTLPTGMLCIGKTGSGKTISVLNMLSNKHMLKDTWDFIYLFVGVKPDPEMIKVLDIPKENIKKDFTEEEISNLMDKLERTVEKQGMANTPQCLFLFDDILGRPEFLRSKTFSKLVTTNRHMGITWIALSQYYRKMPVVARTNASYYMIFPSSMVELEKVAEELTPPNMNKKQFIKVAQHATNEKYSFLSINTKADPNKQLRKGFDKVLSLND
jgi:hypothetical protein